ncbi:hypothetical protein LINGRAHAP2_LOCUS2914 [Linum grandiflorum]
MVPGANKSSSDHHPNKLLDRHVRDMVNTITHRVSGIPTGTTTDDDELQQHGVSVITLAGTNTGATMRGEFDRNKKGDMEDQEEEEEEDNVGTYVNSNFQAVNNSIMLDSKYTTNDPGVHLDISDHRRQGKLDSNAKKNNVVDDDHQPSKSRGGRRRRHSEHDVSNSETE